MHGKTKKMKFYIYSFKITDSNKFTGLRKIGFTGKANPKSRVKEWERDTGFNFDLVNSWIFHCEDRFEIEKIERAIQRRFTNVKDLPAVFGREWYRHATDYDINRISKEYQAKSRLLNAERQLPTIVDKRIEALKAAEKRSVHYDSGSKIIRKSKKLSKNKLIAAIIAALMLAVYVVPRLQSITKDPNKQIMPTINEQPVENETELGVAQWDSLIVVKKTEKIKDAANNDSIKAAESKTVVAYNDSTRSIPSWKIKKAEKRTTKEVRKKERQEARKASKEARKAAKNKN